MGWVYFIQHGGPEGAIKIGTTSGNPHARLRALQTGAPEPLRLLAAVPGDARLERELHAKFEALRTREGGEWFAADPRLRAFIDGIAFGQAQPEDDECVDEPEDGFYGLTTAQVWALQDLAHGVALRERYCGARDALADAVSRGDVRPWHVDAAWSALERVVGWVTHAPSPAMDRALLGLVLEDERAALEGMLRPAVEVH